MIPHIWKMMPGKYFCLSTKDSRKKWKDHFFTKDQFSKIRTFLEENSDKDIYFCPHGFSKKERLKEFAEPPPMLWADLDEADPTAKEFKPKPTICIESSPGRFVGLWLLKVSDKMTESVNRRLTYKLGADKGGWDLTQVLRYPGTTNYKYRTLPKVRVRWDDGPTYSMKDIEKHLPDEEDEEEGDLDAAEVFKRYEKKIPSWARQEIMRGKPTPGKRSEVIWKLEHALVEAGMSSDEVFVVIKASPWNKFRGRHNEDEQLRREVDKIITQNLKKGKAKSEEGTKPYYKYFATSLEDVEEKNIDWLVYPYFARGEVTIIEGDPGIGKSYMLQMFCKAFADGQRVPSVKPGARVQGKIIYCDMENDAASVTKKRLKYNGLEHYENFIQEEMAFSIDDDEAMPHILEGLQRVRPLAVCFDPVNIYVGGIDTHNAAEVQQQLARFKEIAKRFNCAVIIVRHLKKSKAGGGEKAIYLGMGSIAFAGVARVVISVGIHPEDPDVRVMAVTKMNIAKKPKALTFTIKALPDTLKERDRSIFEWGEFVDLTSDQILSAAPDKENNGTKDREIAKEFLEGVLEDGPIEAQKLFRMAEKRSITERTLQRAAEEIGIVKEVKGFGKEKKSVWGLPG